MLKSKWSDFYNSEQELIEDMLLCKSDEKSVPYFRLVKGYGFIESFKKYYRKNGYLTDKQMVQLKRLASEVYKNVYETNKLKTKQWRITKMNRLKKELKKRYITGESDEISIMNSGYDYAEYLVCFTKDVIVTKFECNVLDSEFHLYSTKNFELIAIQNCYPETQFFGDTGNKWNVNTEFGFPDDYE